MAARIAALEKEAARLHEEAKKHNLDGDFEGAKAAYRQMYAVEDESLRLAAEVTEEEKEKEKEKDSEESSAADEYASLLSLPASPWPDQGQYEGGK